jgi:hypothetical protein
MCSIFNSHRLIKLLCATICSLLCLSAPATPTNGDLPQLGASALASDLQVGDVVFIRVTAKPFLEVADATLSWTNHVGVVIATDGSDPVIAESTFPRSRTTTLSRFLQRSEQERVAVTRLNTPMSAEQQQALEIAAKRRLGIWYDTGFNLHSKGEFCSRYVREVLAEATGTEVGEVESFRSLLSHNPHTKLGFWKLWYMGNIPWQRETVTPASILLSPSMHTVFDGLALTNKRG